MRCAVTMEKIVRHSSAYLSVYQGKSAYPVYYPDYADLTRLRTSGVRLAAGTYTVSADTGGEDITCKVLTYTGGGTSGAGIFPASGEGELPYTFTLPEARMVYVNFAYAGWGDDEITPDAVTGVTVYEGDTPTDSDVWETVALHPDELPDSDTITKAINSKTVIALRILPQSEAWQFAEKSVTYVRVFDLDKLTDRIVFRGRVSAISDSMDDSGGLAQEVTCVSSLDFLDDTAFKDENFSGYLSQRVMRAVVVGHNNRVDNFRQFGYTLREDAYYDKGGLFYGSRYSLLTEVLLGDNLRPVESGRIGSDGYHMEFRESFTGDANTLEIAEKFGQTADTAILIGDNLRSIRVDKALQDAVYTSVRVFSGVNSNGTRYETSAINDENYTKYGDGHDKIIVNDGIKCTAPTEGRWIGGEWYPYQSSEAYIAMQTALAQYARDEAAKLSIIPMKLTVSAVDLAAMGYTGYEPFEVGNSHPVICPPLGLNGEPMRITALKRRLSDGRIEQLTLETGTAAPKKSGSLSAMMARLDEMNKQISDSAVDQAEIAATKAEEQVGGYKIVGMAKAEYDALSEYDPKTMYIVDNNGTTEVYIGDQFITQKGGGGATIENAIVLSSEQMQTWAPDHALLPVTFRGEATAYYTGVPAYFVLQGHRCCAVPLNLSNVTPDDVVSELELTFRTGEHRKLAVFIYKQEARNVWLGLIEYDMSGASPTIVGTYAWGGYWELPSTQDTLLKFGLSISNVNFYINSQGLVASRYWVNAWCFLGNTLATPVTSGGSNPRELVSALTLFTNHANVDFATDAERNFAYGLASRTEPVYPNGGA